MKELKNKRSISTGILTTIVILVAIVSAGGVYVYLNNKENKEKDNLNSQIAELKNEISELKNVAAINNDTAGWKTYTNSSYGYSFRYPTDWTLNASDIKSVTIDSAKNEKLRGTIYEGWMEDITVSAYNSLAETDSSLNNDPNVKNAFSNVAETTLAGQKAYEEIEGGFGAYYVLTAMNNSRGYKILFGNVDSREKLTLIDKEIISTFQFTK